MASDERTANLLGALALTLADRADAAVRDGAGIAGSDAAALVTLRNYAEGEPLELLRKALALSHPASCAWPIASSPAASSSAGAATATAARSRCT